MHSHTCCLPCWFSAVQVLKGQSTSSRAAEALNTPGSVMGTTLRSLESLEFSMRPQAFG